MVEYGLINLWEQTYIPAVGCLKADFEKIPIVKKLISIGKVYETVKTERDSGTINTILLLWLFGLNSHVNFTTGSEVFLEINV